MPANDASSCASLGSDLPVADIGAGSGYYVVRLSPIVGPPWPYHRRRCRTRIFAESAQSGA